MLLVVVTFLALVVLFALPCSPLMKMNPRIASTPSLLAYQIAVARGCDVDKPRNLAKSVTVE